MQLKPSIPWVSKKIVYVRPSLARGGVTFSDLEFLNKIQELGGNILIYTGCVYPDIEKLFREDYKFEVKTDTYFSKVFLNRKISGEKKVKRLLDVLNKHINSKNDVYIFSNQFFGRWKEYALATAKLSQHVRALHRIHDFVNMIDEINLLESTDSVLLSISNVITDYLKEINSNFNVVQIPPVVTFDRFISIQKQRDEIRKQLGFEKNEIVIFQPTRVAFQKGIGRAIDLAGKLQSNFGGEKKVTLVIAGGNESFQFSSVETARLKNLLVGCKARVIMCEGLQNITEIPKYYVVADLVTYMSDWEGMGLAPIEAAVSGKLLVTNHYLTPGGKANFDVVYKGYKCVFADLTLTDSVPESVVSEVLNMLKHPEKIKQYTDFNMKLIEDYDTSKISHLIGKVLAL